MFLPITFRNFISNQQFLKNLLVAFFQLNWAGEFCILFSNNRTIRNLKWKADYHKRFCENPVLSTVVLVWIFLYYNHVNHKNKTSELKKNSQCFIDFLSLQRFAYSHKTFQYEFFLLVSNSNVSNTTSILMISLLSNHVNT